MTTGTSSCRWLATDAVVMAAGAVPVASVFFWIGQMLQFQFRPYDDSSVPRVRNRDKARFQAAWSKTLDLLERELQHLEAREIVIQADVTTDMIKNDGMLRANASPSTPRICLSFVSKHGPLRYPCDQFTFWQDNVRAIALALEALRAVDRYGVTKRAEQYKGWYRLPSTPSRSALIRELHELAGIDAHEDITNAELPRLIKSARVRCHPDRHNGDDRMIRRVNEIANTLGETA